VREFNEQHLALASVYAEALYAIAKERAEAESLLVELRGLAGLLAENAALREYLSSPLVEERERATSIERLLRGRASDLLVDALQVVNRKGRSAIIPAIAEAYRRAYDRQTGRLDVDVSTAVPLSDSMRAKLREAVRAFTGHDASLHERVDASLLSGMIVAFGDEKFDTSAAAALRRLHAALLDRASRQIMAGVLASEG
jgi:F-type H+-transporting ATPase subunit delta